MTKLLQTETLIRKVITDIINKSRLDWVSLFLSFDYSLSSRKIVKDLGDYQSATSYIFEFNRNLDKNFRRKDTESSINFEELRQDMIDNTESTVSTEEINPGPKKKKKKNKGFRPRFLDELVTMETFNLQPCDGFYHQRVKPLLFKERELKSTELTICKEFFRNFVLEDEERKELWRFKIGNKLRITKDIFNGLMTRLSTGDFCKKIDRQIQADLDRTFPDCKTFVEGKEMYSKMHLILLLFHIYRPDIGYVQGMNDVLNIIFYYYDVYESFVLFTNLVITNKIMFNMFNFDLEKVRIK